MVRQEHEFSCGAACIRQILLDAGLDVPESRIRELAGLDPMFGGIFTSGMASALAALHDGQRYRAGGVDMRDFDKLLRIAPFIVLLHKHWVIVDRAEPGLVYVRDPAGMPGDGGGTGCVGVILREVFDEQWKLGFHQVVFRL